MSWKINQKYASDSTSSWNWIIILNSNYYLITDRYSESETTNLKTEREPSEIERTLQWELTLETHHVYSTLKRHGNSRFHVILTLNTRGVFVG